MTSDTDEESRSRARSMSSSMKMNRKLLSIVETAPLEEEDGSSSLGCFLRRPLRSPVEIATERVNWRGFREKRGEL